MAQFRFEEPVLLADIARTDLWVSGSKAWVVAPKGLTLKRNDELRAASCFRHRGVIDHGARIGRPSSGQFEWRDAVAACGMMKRAMVEMGDARIR